jgi:RNA polymerase sigma-70 factor (ECF subfamily)
VVVEDVEKKPRLSELSTQWTMLFQAHHGTPEEVGDALRLMMLRYSGAVHRYLLKTVGDPEEVKELDQEFALRFLKGNFLKYNPSYGRFRDYVKGAVRNLMIDYHRRKGKTRRLDTDMEMAIVGGSGLEDLDQRIIDAWRDDLLDRAWNALVDFEQRTGQPYHTVLKFRVSHPKDTSAQMAEKLAPRLGRTLSAGACRQLLLRARDKWAGSLTDLRLLHLCKPVLKRLDFDVEKG